MFLLSSAERTTITTHQSFQVSYTVDIQSSVITLYVQYTLYVIMYMYPISLISNKLSISRSVLYAYPCIDSHRC